MLAGNLPCIYNRTCQWYDTEKLVLAPRRSEEEEQKDVDPEQLTLITQKERNVSQSRGDSMLKLTANRETLIHRASEQGAFARTVEIGQFKITKESAVDGNSSIFLKNTEGQGILEVEDYKQFLQIT